MGRGCPSVEVVENIRSGANKLWLERVVARTSSSFLLEGLWIPATPSNKGTFLTSHHAKTTLNQFRMGVAANPV